VVVGRRRVGRVSKGFGRGLVGLKSRFDVKRLMREDRWRREKKEKIDGGEGMVGLYRQME
jgi:hypothetical protein